MLEIADVGSIFQDRYQALIIPVPTSGVLHDRALLKIQHLYPLHFNAYRQACQSHELKLGGILCYHVRSEETGMGIAPALSKPQYIVDMAITEFSEHSPHTCYIEQCLKKLSELLITWQNYEGIRRIALLATDSLFLPDGKSFDSEIMPLLEKYLHAMSGIRVIVYR